MAWKKKPVEKAADDPKRVDHGENCSCIYHRAERANARLEEKLKKGRKA